jgi:hypothetical protein
MITWFFPTGLVKIPAKGAAEVEDEGVWFFIHGMLNERITEDEKLFIEFGIDNLIGRENIK